MSFKNNTQTNKQASILAPSFHFLFLSYQLQLPTNISRDVVIKVNFNEHNICSQIFEQHASLLKSLMYMTIENFTMGQQ
jgi:hypothetical protein